MSALNELFNFIGPTVFALLPLSVIALALVFHVFFCLVSSKKISDWAEVSLSYIHNISVSIGLLGSVLALSNSFNIQGASVDEIRNRLFLILSTGFYSTIAGVIVSLTSSVGLLAMKKV